MNETFDYNPKIDIKFLSHVCDSHTYFESELRIKKIYKRIIRPSTFSEHFFMTTVEAFTYIQNAQKLGIDSLKTIVHFFDKNIEVRSDEFEPLIILINSYKHDFSTLSIAEVFIASMIAFKNSDRQLSLSILFCNFNRIQAHKYPIIFFNSFKYGIRNLITNYGFDKEKLFPLFDEMEERTNHYNRPHPFVSLEEVLSKIQLIKDVLINYYKLKCLKIYGSYSRGEATEYSDLDLYGEIEKEYVGNYNKLNLVNYLKEQLSIPVDVFLKHEIGIKKRVPHDMFDDVIEVFSYD